MTEQLDDPITRVMFWTLVGAIVIVCLIVIGTQVMPQARARCAPAARTRPPGAPTVTLTTVSEKRNRVYRRKFDHDEALQRHGAGEPIADLARAYGVTYTAVKRVLDPDYRARHGAAHDRFQASGKCVDCGGPCSRRNERCIACSAVARSTSARPGELWCSRCRTWKRDRDFPRHRGGRGVRRGRHTHCRACGTKMRQDYRNRHKVPCARCGQPRLPKSETGGKGNDTGLCLACYRTSIRKAA